MQYAMSLVFVSLTFVCWGIYGPVLHEGQKAMSGSSLRPFLCVGLAYFLVAVVVPLVLMRLRREEGEWTVPGLIWSLAAGVAGAVGALGIILAFKARGNPLYVMPLVFGGAPVVNTVVTMWMSRSLQPVGKMFITGVLLVALGSAGVMYFKPKAVGHAHVPIAATADQPDANTPDAKKSTPELAMKSPQEQDLFAKELFAIVGAITLTACCWGCYGPVLHRGQSAMGGSRLRPLLCVGLAYFLIAVIVPSLVLLSWQEPGGWTWGGSVWSLVAGTAGAVGALGIIMAFNYGGRPIYVMPLVFGGAPIINTITSVLPPALRGQDISAIGPWFYLSLLLVAAGAVIVLLFAPRPRPGPVPH